MLSIAQDTINELLRKFDFASPQEKRFVAHEARLMNTAAIDDLSYLTYFPFPLSIS